MSEAHLDTSRQENPVVRPQDAADQPEVRGVRPACNLLLPCPFCGTEDNLHLMSQPDNVTWRVFIWCGECQQEFMSFTGRDTAVEAGRAIAKWNARAGQQGNTASGDDHPTSMPGKPA